MHLPGPRRAAGPPAWRGAPAAHAAPWLGAAPAPRPAPPPPLPSGCPAACSEEVFGIWYQQACRQCSTLLSHAGADAGQPEIAADLLRGGSRVAQLHRQQGVCCKRRLQRLAAARVQPRQAPRQLLRGPPVVRPAAPVHAVD